MLLKFENVSFSSNKKNILDNVSFGISQNEKVGIVTRSGEGMSSILKLASGLISPLKGNIYLRGHDTVNTSKYELMKDKSKHGFYFQHNALLYSMSVYDNLTYYYYINTNMTDQQIEDIVLEKLDEFGFDREGIDKFPIYLTPSEKKLINYIRAIIHSPDLLFVDDILSFLNLDILFDAIENYISENDVALVMSHSSITTLKRFINRVIVVHEGRIYFDGDVVVVDSLAGEDRIIKSFL